MSKAADDEILALSLARNAVVVTLDADFHAILAVSGAQGPSVIRMRLQGLGAPEVVEVVRKVMASFEVELNGGS
jgi:predicted nuclease of predicted toxin-antitoxin system